MIFIFSYDRPKFLLRLLKELEGEQIVVLDDGSTYPPDKHLWYCDYYRLSHKGKQGFYVNWNFALEIAQESTDTEFIFLPDDIYDFDIDRLRKDYNGGCLNVLDVGADRGWTPKGYVDCVFMCNREVLEALQWKLDPVPIVRFNNPDVSSGVGQQMSKRLWKMGIPMYLQGNYAQHGNHPSKMHPETRLRQPLCTTQI